jgi:hypothetical protein
MQMYGIANLIAPINAGAIRLANYLQLSSRPQRQLRHSQLSYLVTV